MNVKNLIGTVLDTVIKIVLIVVVVVYTYRYAVQAYDFGYRVFAEEPVSASDGAKIISISVTEEATVEEIGTVLEEKGMIRDARLFYVQELLSSYHDKIKPGIYELRSDMTAREMLAVISAEPSEAEEGTESSGGGGQEPAEEAEMPEEGTEAGEEEPEGGDPQPEDGEAGTE